MGFLTRDQLIRAGKWKTAEMEADEGTFRLARPAADAALRLMELGQKGGENQVEVFAESLRSCLVDQEGAPVFSTLEDARQALGSISLQTLVKMAGVVSKLQGGLPQEGAKDGPGGSGASQSAASPSDSPSGSAGPTPTTS